DVRPKRTGAPGLDHLAGPDPLPAAPCTVLTDYRLRQAGDVVVAAAPRGPTAARRRPPLAVRSRCGPGPRDSARPPGRRGAVASGQVAGGRSRGSRRRAQGAWTYRPELTGPPRTGRSARVRRSLSRRRGS